MFLFPKDTNPAPFFPNNDSAISFIFSLKLLTQELYRTVKLNVSILWSFCNNFSIIFGKYI